MSLTTLWSSPQSDPVFLLVLLQSMYVELGLVEKLSIPMNALRHFVAAVFVEYNDNPYHNFNHCFCVTQMVCAGRLL